MSQESPARTLNPSPDTPVISPEIAKFSGQLKQLNENIEKTKTLREAFTKQDPEYFNNVKELVWSYGDKTILEATNSQNYLDYMNALSLNVQGRIARKLGDSISRLTGEDISDLEKMEKIQNTADKLYKEEASKLAKLAGMDETINYAEIVDNSRNADYRTPFGELMAPYMRRLNSGERPKKPELVKSLEGYLTKSLLNTAKTMQLEQPANNTEEFQNSAPNLFRKEMYATTLFVVGSGLLTGTEFESLLAKVGQEAKKNKLTEQAWQLAMGGGDNESGGSEYLLEVVDEEQGTTRAEELYDREVKKALDMTREQDSSGTILAKYGSLTAVISDLLKDIFIGKFLIETGRGRFGQAALAAGSAAVLSEVVVPGSVSKYFETKESTMKNSEQVSNSFENLSPPAQQWVYALDLGNNNLKEYLTKQIRDGRKINFTKLKQYLAPPNKVSGELDYDREGLKNKMDKEGLRVGDLDLEKEYGLSSNDDKGMMPSDRRKLFSYLYEKVSQA